MIRASAPSIAVLSFLLASQAHGQVGVGPQSIQPPPSTPLPADDVQTSSTTPPADVAAEQSGTPDTADRAGEITVTGSRITRDGTRAPTPLTVIGAEQLQQQAVTRLVDFARNVPALKDAGGARRGNNGFLYGGQGSLNLRSLGANRNLILLDRRRVAPSTATGVVDINTLPSALVQRVDVVTGGASAAWGSDAVSGVINFILDTRFEGLKFDAVSGVSSHGDNGEQTVSIAGGTKIGDRARLIGSLEYFNGEGQAALSRDFLRARPGIVNNPAWTATNGQPRYIVADRGIVTSYMTRGGIINGCRSATGANIANCSLRGIAFATGGTPFQFQYGTYVSPTGNMIAPAGADLANGEYNSIYDGVLPTSPSMRVSAFSHFEYDLTDDLKFFVEGTVARNKTSYVGVAPYRFGTSATTWLSVTADNAFLPPSVKAQMSGPGGGNPAGPFYLNVGRSNDDLAGFAPVKNTNTFMRVVTGLDGRLGDSWKWNVYYQYGQNEYDTSYGNSLITSRNGVTALGNVNLAVDAVVAPAGNAAGIPAGTIVCRSTLTNPGNGCQPLNIFGRGAASQQAIDYVLGVARLTAQYRQHVVEGAVQGDLFSIWAGPVTVAAGGSYRQESTSAVSDALSREFAFGVVNPQPFAGSYSVKEAFGELAIPLAKDWRFAKALDLSLAGRITDYSTSGTVETWKAGVTYTPFDGLRLRGTRSRDIRAASLDELYRGGAQARVSVTDTPSGSSSQINILQLTGGNRDLTPEIADTLSYGVVFTPRFLSGFSFSIDRYDIKIKNVISTISSQEILDRCARGNATFCNLVTRQNGALSTITANFLNLALLSTDGLDIEASYRRDISDWLGGNTSIGIRALANYVNSFQTSDGRITIQQAGSIADTQPKWSGFGSYFIRRGDAQVTVSHNYVGSGKIRQLYDDDPLQRIDNNRVASRIYTNLNISYDVAGMGGNTQFFVNVDNILNVKPPRGFGFGYGLNAAPLYDVVGPLIKIGLKGRF